MDLFEKSNDLSFEMKNRFIRSATHESMATIDGKPSDDLRKLYLKLQKVGLELLLPVWLQFNQMGRLATPCS